MGKLHIAFLIDSMHGGGAEHSVLTVIESLLQRNYKVDLLLLEFRGKRLTLIPDGTNLYVLDSHIRRVHQVSQCSIPIDKIHWIQGPAGFMEKLVSYIDCLKLIKNERLQPRIRFFHSMHSMSEYLESRKPDLIVAHLFRSYCISVLGRKLSSTNIPVIWTIHNDDLNLLAGKNRTYFNHFIREVDRIHTVSRGLADSVTEYLGSCNLLTDQQEVTSIYNAFNSDRIYCLAKLPVKHEWFGSVGNCPLSEDTKIILAVGRLCEQKNYEMLIRAFSMILDHVDARLLILGEGGGRNQLEILVEELDIAHAISMPGWVDNPYSFMANADVFVLSSNYEGMAMVISEALICGCPVVSTDCPSGPREILEDGRWGHLTPVNDEDALVAAILDSLSNDVNRSVLKARGADFDIDTLVVEYEKLYHEVIDETKPNILH